MEEIMIDIENDRKEFVTLLGEDFLEKELVRVDIPEKLTVSEFWKKAHMGTFMILTQAERQRSKNPAVRVNVLKNGTLYHATSAILKREIVSVHEVTSKKA